MNKKGVALIVVLMTIVVFSVLVAGLIIYTQSHASSTTLFGNRKRAFLLGESGEDFYMSFIPNTDMMRTVFDTVSGYSNETYQRSRFIEGSLRKVYEDSLGNSGKYFIWPIPMNIPYKQFSPAGDGREEWVYDFSTSGYIIHNGFSRSFSVAASFELPFTAMSGKFGHTMY